MKNLITSIACVMLLMAFVVQFAHMQVIYQQTVMINCTMDIAQETVIEDGKMTAENQRWLKEKVSAILGCETEAVSIIGAEKEVPEGESFQYVVKFPMEKVFATPGFWGIEAAENYAEYVITREAIRSAEEGEKR